MSAEMCKTETPTNKILSSSCSARRPGMVELTLRALLTQSNLRPPHNLLFISSSLLSSSRRLPGVAIHSVEKHQKWVWLLVIQTLIYYLPFLLRLPFSSSIDFSPLSTSFLETNLPLLHSCPFLYCLFLTLSLPICLLPPVPIIPSSLHPYLHPVSIHFMEENTERVRLGGYISVQQAGCGDGQLNPCDAVLRSDTERLALSGRAEGVGHYLRSQLITLKGKKRTERNFKYSPTLALSWLTMGISWSL